MKTTLKQIRAAKPCGMHLEDGERVGYLKLQHYLGPDYTDAVPISIASIIDSNGLEDAHWCMKTVEGHDREIHLYAVWCASQVKHLMKHKDSHRALEVSTRYANGKATVEELKIAQRAAWDAFKIADTETDRQIADTETDRLAAMSAWGAALNFLGEAADSASAAVAKNTGITYTAAQEAQATELRRICECIDEGTDPYPENVELTACVF